MAHISKDVIFDDENANGFKINKRRKNKNKKKKCLII